MKHSIALHAEHLKGDKMIVTGTDSLSRMAEFSVTWSIFRHLNRLDGFGRRGSNRGYRCGMCVSSRRSTRIW